MLNRREFLAMTGLGGAAIVFGITNSSNASTEAEARLK